MGPIITVAIVLVGTFIRRWGWWHFWIAAGGGAALTMIGIAVRLFTNSMPVLALAQSDPFRFGLLLAGEMVFKAAFVGILMGFGWALSLGWRVARRNGLIHTSED